MHLFKNFTKVTLSLITIIGLAVAAALLPSLEKKQTGIFSLSPETEENLAENLANQENIDLLFFTLRPKKSINTDPISRITRPAVDLEELKKQLAANQEASMPKDKIILTENSGSENLIAKVKAIETEQYTIRIAAASKQDTTSCAEIGNANAAEDCKDEITFQKAVTQAKPELCEEIIDSQLKKRCESSF
ncbi:MAG: hypothetical protein PHO48_02010 [Candidatus Gracilibacteria bacterium]|nr:hypothetical protein [Candidatus Gracilibacteria bacterium]MDD5178919.1 hypothetical protein [Candidatus Gracilibacteria bacterium]